MNKNVLIRTFLASSLTHHGVSIHRRYTDRNTPSRGLNCQVLVAYRRPLPAGVDAAIQLADELPGHYGLFLRHC